jgi:threonine dehydrogenase-like Zn-dependent dehydrogenase
MPKSIQFVRSKPRWLLVRGLAGRHSGIASGPLSCIRLAETQPPSLPSPQWVRIQTRLSGICGSDLSTIACAGSPYFSPFVSTPFVLGHELVGEIVELGADVPGSWRSGMRVVLEPALGCEVRGIEPRCRLCSQGRYSHCENVLRGSIRAGIQTGYCASTGGGWSNATVVAHHSQLHAVPSSVSDDEAVLAEPLACSLHAALLAPREKECSILVIGCGTIGLLAIHAYRKIGGHGRVLAAARYSHQANMASQFGADETFVGHNPDGFYRWVLENTEGSFVDRLFHPELGKPVVVGGADAVLDCVGSSRSIDDALRLTRSRGTVVLAGMPGVARGVDWTSAWHKELRVQGAYAYGWEEQSGARTRTMRTAIEIIENGAGALQPLVTSRFALGDYRAALENAFHAGRSGSVKTVFQIES